MQKKTHIKKGDLVIVISGNDKGEKTHRVIEINRETNRVLVEGVNMIKRHTKPNAQYPDGGIINKEAPIHISNLMYVDPATGKPAKVGRKLNAEGKMERFAKTTEASK